MKLSKLWDLKLFLETHGIKQKYFAKEIGVTVVTVSNWMRKKSSPTPLTQKRIEKYLKRHYEAKYPTYYSLCCDAEANDVKWYDVEGYEGICSKCWKACHCKERNTNAS